MVRSSSMVRSDTPSPRVSTRAVEIRMVATRVAALSPGFHAGGGDPAAWLSPWARRPKIRAERRAGEILTKVERKQGARTDKETSADSAPKSPNYSETIEEAGIKKDTALRWQLEASLPDWKGSKEWRTLRQCECN